MFQAATVQKQEKSEGLNIGCVVDHIPSGIREQYKNTGILALEIALRDSQLVSRIKKEKVFVIPIGSLSESPAYLEDINDKAAAMALKKTVDELKTKNAKADSLSVMEKGRNIIFVTGNAFQSIGKLSVILNHELHHIALVAESKQGKTWKEDEIKTFTQSTASMSRVIGTFQQQTKKTKDAKTADALSKLISEMKDGLDRDRRTLEQLKKSKSP